MNRFTAFVSQLRGTGLRAMARLADGVRILHSVLREIFDESAYARFLDRRGLESSQLAYAEFQREGQVARERRPRCC